jgi:stage II sporulation protein R
MRENMKIIEQLLIKKTNQPNIHIENTIRKSEKSHCKYNSQLNLWLLICILFISGLATVFIHAKTAYSKALQFGIANEIIRFHVIANSDSKEDQDLKYLVKNGLVKELSPYLKNAQSIFEARNIINQRLIYIQKSAESIIRQNGYFYPVSVSLSSCRFPIKIYGNYTFPAGNYEALRIQIGKAQGQNWWCVMFPPLCFVDQTYNIVNKETEEQLKYLLTEEEINSLKASKAPVKIKFKLWEIIKKFFSK